MVLLHSVYKHELGGFNILPPSINFFSWLRYHRGERGLVPPIGRKYYVCLYVSVYRLKIDEMTVDDSGIYTCEGFNRYGRQSTNGSVVVRQGAFAFVIL